MILTAAGVDEQFQKLWHCFGQLNLSHCFIITVIVVIVVIVVVIDFIVVVIDFIIFIVDFIIFVITSRTRLAFGQLGLPEMCHSWDGHHTTLNGLLGVQM